MTNLLEIINNQINRSIHHGASLALFKDGQWSEHYIGTTDDIAPVKPGLIYDLTSVSKVVGIGTVTISPLYQGKLELGAPLVRCYSDFHKSSVTLRQLLTHSSGINPFIPSRDSLNAAELKEAINHITMESKKEFSYTDISFLLPGFMLEEIYSRSLDVVLKDKVFQLFGMTNAGSGPVRSAVSMVVGVSDGLIHDPKAKVLGVYSGSAGLSSSLQDLEEFCQHYLTDGSASDIWQDFSQANKERSLTWNKGDDWLDHTGYTSTYMTINRKKQKAAIFLTNRTHAYDDRPLWIEGRQRIS